jgi:hypothetical protein
MPPPEPSVELDVSGSLIFQIRTSGQQGEFECTETNPAFWIAQHFPRTIELTLNNAMASTKKGEV